MCKGLSAIFEHGRKPGPLKCGNVHSPCVRERKMWAKVWSALGRIARILRQSFEPNFLFGNRYVATAHRRARNDENGGMGGEGMPWIRIHSPPPCALRGLHALPD